MQKSTYCLHSKEKAADIKSKYLLLQDKWKSNRWTLSNRKPVIIQAICVIFKLASILEQVLLFQTSCNHTVILSTLQLSILTNKNAGLGHSSLGILCPYNSNAVMVFIETWRIWILFKQLENLFNTKWVQLRSASEIEFV